MIDLHTHSTASDGSSTPAELVEQAKAAGLSAVALTDHDTVAGNAEAMEAGKQLGIEVIPGCELSVASPDGAGWLHIVGLWVPENPEDLQTAFDWLHDGRRTRNHEILDKLKSQGINITYEDVKQFAKGTVGRPHIARAMLHQGVVGSMDEAFRVWLGDHGRCYVPKRKLDPADALRLLREAGATSILAHPFTLGLKGEKLDALLAELKEMGLQGMEVHYTEHSEGDTKRFLQAAEHHELLVSGGSDFHGMAKPKTRIAVGKGGLHVPDELLETMKQSRREQGLWVTEAPVHEEALSAAQ